MIYQLNVLKKWILILKYLGLGTYQNDYAYKIEHVL